MYRSTPHSTTGVSPLELLYGREYRTKLPQLAELNTDTDFRDRDSGRKEKGKIYGDSKRNAVTSDIHQGDKVLLKQQKTNKLSTPVRHDRFTVVYKNWNSVLVKGDRVQYKRNITHAKKLLDQNPTSGSQSGTVREHELVEQRPAKELVQEKPSNEAEEHSPEDFTVDTRAVRIRKLPADYVVGYIVDLGQ